MKRPTSLRLSDLSTRQLAELISATGLTQSEVVSTAIDRMYQQEIKTMTTATITISTGTYTLEQLANLVATASNRGEWYDGKNSTHISDWLAEGDYSGDETIESLAAEWDK